MISNEFCVALKGWWSGGGQGVRWDAKTGEGEGGRRNRRRLTTSVRASPTSNLMKHRGVGEPMGGGQ